MAGPADGPGHRLLRAAIGAVAAAAAGLLTRSMVRAVSAPDDGTGGSAPTPAVADGLSGSGARSSPTGPAR
jgi:hypothetical protein